MGKNQIRNLEIHVAENIDRAGLARQVGEFHVAVIQRRIARANLPTDQLILLMERVIEKCRGRDRAAFDS